MNTVTTKWPDPQQQERAALLAMRAWSGHGFGISCDGCGRSASWTAGEMLDKLAPFLLHPAGVAADRTKCRTCGHVGADIGPTFGENFWNAEGGLASGMTQWQANDVHLRRMLNDRGLPLEIADACWRDQECQVGDHPDWRKPRWRAIEGAPLSAAGQADLDAWWKTSRNGLANPRPDRP